MNALDLIETKIKDLVISPMPELQDILVVRSRDYEDTDAACVIIEGGSLSIDEPFRGTDCSEYVVSLSVAVYDSADTSDREAFQARVDAIEDRLSNSETVRSLVNETGDIHIYQSELATIENGSAARQWETVLTFRIQFAHVS